MSVKRPAISPRGIGMILILGALALAPAGSLAQTLRPTPPGIQAGKWILAPYGFFGVQWDSNIFRRPADYAESVQGAPGVESDWIQRTTLGLDASVPVRNSAFQFEYVADRFAYQNTTFSRDWSQFFRAAWLMNLSSGDQISLGTSYTKGFTNLQDVDPGGELTFSGQPYDMARWDLVAERGVPRRQGYLIRLTRIDLNWDPSDPVTGEPISVPFFDYRGWDARYEYRQPVSVIDWFIVYGSMRRFNHYRARGYEEWNPDSEEFEPAWELGVPFRKEESGSIQLGVRGYVGRGQPFFGRVGYGEFGYTGQEASESDFRGLVGEFHWSLLAAPRTTVELGAIRRPLPSTFRTYYISNEFRVQAQREWRQYSSMGVDLLLSRNKYGDLLPEFVLACNGEIRQDERWQAQAFVNWKIHRKLGVRVAAGHYVRNSNCEGSDYRANIIETGLTMGWF